MATGLPRNWSRPTPGSWLERWLSANVAHPDAFDCGVRVVEGAVARLGRRWTFRVSAVDPYLPEPDVVTLNHGPALTLQLRVAAGNAVQPNRDRVGHVVLWATETGGGAVLQLSVPLGDLERFGVVA